MEEPEWELAKEKWKIGQVAKATVVHCAPHGVFVDLGAGAVGFITVPDLTDVPPATEDDFPEVGDEIEAVVLGYREGNRQIALSMRPSLMP